MTDFGQFLVSGLSLGIVYGVLALGLTVVFNATDTINVAHGAFVVLGAALVTSFAALDIPLIIAAALAVVSVGLVALAEAWAIVLPMARRGAAPLSLLMVTIGFSIVAEQAIGQIWGKGAISFGSFVGIDPIVVGGVAIQRQMLVVLVVGLIAVGSVAMFFRRTRYGKAMLAVSVDRIAASLVGVSPQRTALLAFFISGMVAGLAGVLVAPMAAVSYTQGLGFVLAAFTAAVIGGLTSPTGAVVGGILVGLLESFSAGYVSSEYRDFIVLGTLLLILAVRPTGILQGLKAPA